MCVSVSASRRTELVVASECRCCVVCLIYLVLAYTFQNPATPLKCTSSNLGDIANYSVNESEMVDIMQ